MAAGIYPPRVFVLSAMAAKRIRHARAVDASVKSRAGARLRRIEGQVRGVARMVEEERYCAAVERTCPLHPEVLRPEPGPCPICGMALEPRVATLEEGPNRELIDMRRRFVVSAILSVPLLLSMRFMIPPLLQLALATPVVL